MKQSDTHDYGKFKVNTILGKGIAAEQIYNLMITEHL